MEAIDSTSNIRFGHRYTWLLILTALIAIITGCSNSYVAAPPPSAPAIPIVTYPSSIAATVDCGDDGVANVDAEYGTGAPTRVLVGRNATTQAAGGQTSFSRNYGTAAGYSDSTLTVTTAPTRGTCTTTLTDYDTGNVLAQQESAGRVSLTAIVRAP